MSGKILLYYNDVAFSPSDAFLTRDFGQVPYVLSERHGLDLEFWISAKTLNLNYVSFRGRKVRQFRKMFAQLPDRLDILKNISLYLSLLRLKNISHMVLFPFTPLTDVLVATLAKRRAPGIRLIVKLDANAEFLERVAADWQEAQGWKRIFRQSFYYRKLLQMADAVICETSDCEGILREGFLGLDLGGKLVKAFSGVSQNWLASLGVIPFSRGARANRIVVSGRLSIWVKYTSLIFDAGPPPKGWTIDFIGEVDDDFQKIINNYRKKDRQFDEYYKFHGVVMDKKKYFDILMDSRVLLMNSRGPEGFPNVYADAHFSRLFILTSDIASSYDATCHGRWGAIYQKENAEALRAALRELPDRVDAFDRDPSVDDYRRKFIWEASLAQPTLDQLFDAASPATGHSIV